MPEAGMFFWVRVFVERHPRFHARAQDTTDANGGGRVGAVARTNAKELMAELFEACVARGLLVCPATIFVLPTDGTFESESIDDVSGPFRPARERVMCGWLADAAILTLTCASDPTSCA